MACIGGVELSNELAPEVHDALASFVFHANVTVLHHNDEDRLNEFVLASHLSDSRVSDTFLCNKLREAGFADDYATQLVSYYDIALRLLARYDTRREQ